MEAKCPFWPVCGGAVAHHYWAKLTYPDGDPRRDWIGTVCCDESKCLECEHYEIRINPKKEVREVRAHGKRKDS